MMLISKRLFAGRIKVHVYAQSCPGDGFQSVQPDLEDAYFTSLYKTAPEV